MMITTLFFDLDGTLLPMDLETFTRGYLGSLSRAMAKEGYEPHELVKNVMKGVASMSAHPSEQTNEQAFWQTLIPVYGQEMIDRSKPAFDEYYRTLFDECKNSCLAPNPEIPQLIEKARALGFRLVLATNPLFPRDAIRKRLEWIGLKPEDFELVTTYEDSHYTKPNPEYFKETARRAGIRPEEVLMIGNDLEEDYGAIPAGMKLFVLEDCLIPSKNRSVDEFDHGHVPELEAFLEKLAASQKKDQSASKPE